MIIESFYSLLFLVFTIDYLLWHQTHVKENTSSARLLLSSRGASVAAVATIVKQFFFRKCTSNQIKSNTVKQFYSYSPKSQSDHLTLDCSFVSYSLSYWVQRKHLGVSHPKGKSWFIVWWYNSGYYCIFCQMAAGWTHCGWVRCCLLVSYELCADTSFQ